MPDNPVQGALKAHGERVDAILQRFTSDLERVVAVAQAQLSHALLGKLDLDPNQIIRRTLRNIKLLRQLPQLWQQALDDAGLEAIVQQYMTAFPQQITEFQQVLQTIYHGSEKQWPLPTFSASDRGLFNGLRLSIGSDVSAAVENATARAMTSNVLLAAGSLSFSGLMKSIDKSTNAGISRSTALADTGLMGFYRTIAARGYELIQRETAESLRFLYLGPRDVLNRPFCAHLLDEDKIWTRGQIDEMDSGMGKGTVFVVAGGFRCRHSWNLSSEKMSIQ